MSDVDRCDSGGELRKREGQKVGERGHDVDNFWVGYTGFQYLNCVGDSDLGVYIP